MARLQIEPKAKAGRHTRRARNAGAKMQTRLAEDAGARAQTVGQMARERVLDRIRRALAEGDDAEALRIARELQRRWKTCEARRQAAERQAS